MTLQLDRLAKRGIAAAAQSLEWKDWRDVKNGQWGWAYPMYGEDGQHFTTEAGEVIARWKNWDSAAKPKYLWYPGDVKPLPAYYLIPGVIDEIAQQGGKLYIVSGEPDVLTMIASGIRNAVCWFGEANVPATLASDLVRWGVTSVDEWPDLDKTGRGAALKVREALYGTGIELCQYALPEALGDGGDLNKLWQKVQFDPSAYWGALLSCQHLKLQTDKPELPDKFYEALETALIARGLKRYNEKGFSNLFACPMAHHEHDDRQPAFSYHAGMHIGKCQKCAETGKEIYLAVELGDALNLRWQDYIPQDKPKRAIDRVLDKKSKTIQVRTFREAMLNLKSWLQGDGNYSGNTLIPIPMKDLTHFGGMAEQLLPKKLFGIIAPSGRGKTSAIETWIDEWRLMGFNGMLWGPEWSPEEYGMRYIQRHYGPEVMKIAGAVLGGKYKRPLTDYETREALRQIGVSLELPGELFVLTQPVITGDSLYEVLEPALEAATKVGKPINYVIFDYLQMMRGGNDRGDIAENLGRLKEAVELLDLIGGVGSQVTKSDSRAATQGESLDSDAMQMARSDALNLALTISRRKLASGLPEMMDYDLGEGRGIQPLYVASGRVAKNSLGTEGDVMLYLDGPRMKWVTRSMPQHKVGA